MRNDIGIVTNTFTSSNKLFDLFDEPTHQGVYHTIGKMDSYEKAHKKKGG